MTPEKAPPQPPVNLQAEQLLLAALLSHNPAMERVVDLVRADDFADPAHQRIFAACQALFGKGQAFNAVSLKGQFDQDDALTSAGGPDYLARLQASSVEGFAGFNVQQLARMVADLAQRRRLIEFGQEVVARAHDQGQGADAGDIAGQALAELTDIATAAARGTSDGPRDLLDVGGEALAEIERAIQRRNSGKMAGAPTGLDKLDDLLGGLQDGALIGIGGRPGQGKTALGEGIAWTVADTESVEAVAEGRQPRLTLFVSAEMTGPQILKREIARQIDLTVGRMARGDVDEAAFARAAEVVRQVRGLPLRLMDRNADRPASIFAYARSLHRRQGLRMVVVDYLQIMQPLKDLGNRVQELSAITRACKQCAMDLGVPFVLLAQLGRTVDEREGHRPYINDFKETGSLEQDADVAILVHRAHAWLVKEQPSQRANENAEKFSIRRAEWHKQVEASEGLAELIVAKNRGGPEGSVKVGWNGPRIEFYNLEASAKGDDPPPGLWERG